MLLQCQMLIQIFLVAVLSYEINNQPEIETGVRLRQIYSLNFRRSTVFQIG